MTKKIFIFLFIISIIFLIFAQRVSFNDTEKVLRFSSWGSQSEIKILNSVINDFETANPDIKIDFIHIPQNYFQKLHLLFASGLEPDVIFINNQNISLYEEAGLLENLSPYFGNSEKNFFAAALDCFKYKNSLYAVPRDISGLVIYYNKDIFDDLKIKIPDKINNIYELRDLAIKLTNNGHFGINFEEDSLFWSYYLASNGGGIVSDDKKSVIINSKQSIEALNLYADMINKYHAAPSKSQIGSMTTAQMFINGKLAMYLGGRWMVPKFREVIPFNWDVIEFPSSNENKVYIDASGWAISAKSKNKDEAIKFVKYLSSEEIINRFTDSGLIIPSRIDSAKHLLMADKNKKPKHSAVFTDMIVNAKPTPVNKNFSSVNDIIKETSENIFAGKETPQDAFNEKVIKKTERLLNGAY